MCAVKNGKIDQEATTSFIKGISSEKITRAIILSLKYTRGNSCPAQDISEIAYAHLDFKVPTKFRELIIARIWEEVDLLLKCNALEQYQTNKRVRIKLHEENLLKKNK